MSSDLIGILRTGARPLAVALALFATTQASAQFSNKSLGLALGYMKMNADPSVDWAVPLSLEGSLYIESGFDLVIRVAPMLVTNKISGLQLFGCSFNLGVRYLFSEESLRPYVGIGLAGLYLDRVDQQAGYAGVGAFAGLDYFVADSISIGARAFANIYLMLNTPMTEGFGAQGVVATYF